MVILGPSGSGKSTLYEVTQGKDVANDDEIVISEGYAVENSIKIGGSMKIGDKEYTVAGFMQRPDYLYMLESEDDSYKNVYRRAVSAVLFLIFKQFMNFFISKVRHSNKIP